MAARAGITRQSMGEVIRDLVALDILEMRSDPADRRAKIVDYTDHGLEVAGDGFRYLIELERRFVEEFGDDYEVARDVLARLVDLLEKPGDQSSSSAGGKVG
jgi:DNA-binding MarR family transcriptional regulator